MTIRVIFGLLKLGRRVGNMRVNAADDGKLQPEKLKRALSANGAAQGAEIWVRDVRRPQRPLRKRHFCGD